jgi:DNA-directed RNA polymerase beta' subunit
MKNEMLRTAEEIGQRNVHGVFNQDQLLLYLEKKWIKLPEKFKRYVTDQDLGRFRKELTYILFKAIHVEVNNYKKGKSPEPFDPQTVTRTIKRSLDNVFKTPKEIIEGGIRPGQLFKMEKLTRKTPDEIEMESQNIDELKQTILTMINDETISFVREQVGNPFSPDKVDTKSTYEKAKLDADVTDTFDSIISKGKKLIMDNPGKGGSVIEMVKAGARGNDSNFFQAKVALGSQTMSGERLKEAISGGTRVNPFFLENDPDPAARGYVRNSLFRGMTPTDFFSSAMPARQTQTDTAFKTGDTGYMQKKLMAVCGDYKVCPDGTVRDERGNIVTYLYGGHGMDASRMVKKHENFYFVDVEQIVNRVNAEADSKIRTRREFFKKI